MLSLPEYAVTKTQRKKYKDKEKGKDDNFDVRAESNCRGEDKLSYDIT